MTVWWVIHDVLSYEQNPDIIYCQVVEGKVRYPSFENIKKADKVVYYAKGDKVIIGIFDVVSEMLFRDEYVGKIAAYLISPAVMPSQDHYFDLITFLRNSGQQLHGFPEGDNLIRSPLIHHNFPQVDEDDYEILVGAIKSGRYEIRYERSAKISDKIGVAFENIDLLFEPIDEMGLMYLFARHHKAIGFPYIIKIRSKFPDVIAIDDSGERVNVELEYKSSNFKMHGHNPSDCEYCVCWEHDWKDAPPKLRIISLKDKLKSIYNTS